MCLHIRAHFDGRNFVPDEPVNLPANQTVEMDVTPTERATRPVPTPDQIAHRIRQLEQLGGLLSGPVLPAESLRRENLYEDRL